MIKRGQNKYNAQKQIVHGIEFDSRAEAEFYLILKNDETVKDVKLQPSFEIIKRYEVQCGRCNGSKGKINKLTGRWNNCTLCKGKGNRKKGGAKYTADFKVTYADDRQEVIDVKGYASKDFPLRRKLFEEKTGKELVIARKKGRTWEVK